VTRVREVLRWQLRPSSKPTTQMALLKNSGSRRVAHAICYPRWKERTTKSSRMLRPRLAADSSIGRTPASAGLTREADSSDLLTTRRREYSSRPYIGMIDEA